jgi:hypothetical protein
MVYAASIYTRLLFRLSKIMIVRSDESRLLDLLDTDGPIIVIKL